MSGGLFPMEYKRLLGTLIVLTVGLGSLAAVLDAEALVGATFVIGLLLVVPLVAILGDSLPIVASDDELAAPEAGREFQRGLNGGTAEDRDDPVAALRDRYARGEIDEAEFERRLERLLETEQLEGRIDGDRADRERELDL